MKFIKTRDVISPQRANRTDAGIDFFVPSNIHISTMLDLNPGTSLYDYNVNAAGIVCGIKLKSNKRVLIPSGIHVKLPKNTALIAFNKSGIAHKSGLIVGSCVVDEGYEGEVHISLINTSSEICLIKANAKIVQFILTNVKYNKPEESDKSIEEFYEDSKSTRGGGGFGSTESK